MVNLKLLSDATFQFMLNEKKTETDMLKSARQKTSPFSKICGLLTGKYCFKTVTNYMSQWKRNQNGKHKKLI